MNFAACSNVSWNNTASLGPVSSEAVRGRSPNPSRADPIQCVPRFTSAPGSFVLYRYVCDKPFLGSEASPSVKTALTWFLLSSFLLKHAFLHEHAHHHTLLYLEMCFCCNGRHKWVWGRFTFSAWSCRGLMTLKFDFLPSTFRGLSWLAWLLPLHCHHWRRHIPHDHCQNQLRHCQSVSPEQITKQLRLRVWKNHVYGLCPSSSVFFFQKHNVSETGCFRLQVKRMCPLLCWVP
jgi:hypothetical protein